MDIGCEGHRLSGEDGEGLDWGAFRMYWPGRFWKKKKPSAEAHALMFCFKQAST